MNPIRWLINEVRDWFVPWKPEGRYLEVYHAYQNPYNGSSSTAFRDLTLEAARAQVQKWIAEGHTDAAVVGPSIKYVRFAEIPQS